ncbi:MAG: YfhO family protein [Eubacteriales bacterium]|nr:YfhO family protein [Eubacteriales bacterium]
MEEASRRRGTKYYLIYLLWYTVLFAVITAGVLFIYIKNNKALVWNDDGLPVYLPKVYYFITQMREFFANLLSGKFSFPLYDFSFGLGGAVPFHLEPLYWLYLLFSPEDVETAYGFVLIARFYAAGLSMSAFLLYFRNGRAAALIGSFAYIYCDYGLWGCLQHAQFLVPMILLPLCLISMEEIYQKKRWYLCTIFAWIHIWCGYYFTYMDTLVMGVYFLIRFLGNREGRTLKEFLLRMRTIICSYTLGIVIGNITLINSFASYLSSSRTTSVREDLETNYLYYGKSWYVNVFRDFLTAGRGPGHWLRLGFIPLIYIAVVVLFTKKGKKNLKAGVITGTAFCMIPGAAYVFSGFSNIINRWCYAYAFVLAAALAFLVKDMLSLTKKQLCIAAGLSVPFFLTFAYEFFTGSKKTKYVVLISAASLALSLAGVLLVNLCRKITPRAGKCILVAITAVSLCGAGFQVASSRTGKLATEFPKRGTALEKATETPLAAMTEVEDDTFYRAAAKSVPAIQSPAPILGYNGTVDFSNAVSKDIQDFYRCMGVTTWTLVRMKGFDGRTALDTLSSVKYFAIEQGDDADLPYGYTKVSETEKNGKIYEVYENELALPLGYTYDKTVSEEELMEYTAAERQEVMMQAAALEDTGEESDSSEKNDAQTDSPEESDAQTDSSKESDAQTDSPDKNGVQITGKKAEITDIRCEYMSIDNGTFTAAASGDEKPKMTLEFEVPENCEVYLCIKGLRWDSSGRAGISYKCGDYYQTYSVRGTAEAYYTSQEDYIFNLGYHKDGATSCVVAFPRKMNYQYDEMYIFYQPMDSMSDYADNLREESLENVEVLTNEVRGTISLEKEKFLVLTIPYAKGWTAYVDGEETDICRANLMYTGLMLPEGEHTIELKYHMPGLNVSLALSAAGIVIFAVALVMRRRRRNAA